MIRPTMHAKDLFCCHTPPGRSRARHAEEDVAANASNGMRRPLTSARSTANIQRLCLYHKLKHSPTARDNHEPQEEQSEAMRVVRLLIFVITLACTQVGLATMPDLEQESHWLACIF